MKEQQKEEEENSTTMKVVKGVGITVRFLYEALKFFGGGGLY